MNLRALEQNLHDWAQELGFQQLGISDIDLQQHEKLLERWLALERHGEMGWMARHGRRRSRPAALIPGTCSVVSVRMDYFPPRAANAEQVLQSPSLAYISRYALGRDYHKLLRKRLQALANRMRDEVGDFGYRVFVDSAPVLEKALAHKAGLGWIGKHTNVLNKRAGSWFFLGEIYTDLPLSPTAIVAPTNHCGTCTACMDVCPTRAIVAPYELDARLCISYLTIELAGPIPVHLRPLIGNRVYGCDDCQLFCPWNKFAQATAEDDFSPRHRLDEATLIELFSWTDEQFLERTAGSPIRRIGYERWLRNLAVALGNAPTTSAIVQCLEARLPDLPELPAEHARWALAQHNRGKAPTPAHAP
ncbi:MAG: tRNA epoxyqueuosine(34) reductase QueG [Pseudomonadota bacterium]